MDQKEVKNYLKVIEGNIQAIDSLCNFHINLVETDQIGDKDI